MELTSQNVEETFIDCLCETQESLDGIIIEGIVAKYKFDTDKLEIHKTDIETMLAELPTEFRKDGGGGWSFVNACVDKNGNQWTDLHQRMEQLFCLGIAIGKVQCTLPREMWEMLPGGMPYYAIL